MHAMQGEPSDSQTGKKTGTPVLTWLNGHRQLCSACCALQRHRHHSDVCRASQCSQVLTFMVQPAACKVYKPDLYWTILPGHHDVGRLDVSMTPVLMYV